MEDFICNWNLLFATENRGSRQVEVENDIPVENVNHVSTPHQLPFQTILVVNDIDCYNWKSFLAKQWNGWTSSNDISWHHQFFISIFNI